MSNRRLGFFSRLLDQAPAGERYALATEQIVNAEKHGFESAWVAQHHFHETEGGLPSPLVFLAHVAAQTRSIRLGTGIITLPLENAVRVAEDAAVLDLLSGSRLELGVGSGGTPTSFPAFGHESSERGRIFAEHLEILRTAFAGGDLLGTGNRLYPAAPRLAKALWQATFSPGGGERAGAAGDGLMLSRTQPRTAEAPDVALSELQIPIIEAYLAALPSGATPRIMGSRTVFIADTRAEALAHAEVGLRQAAAHFRKIGHTLREDSIESLAASLDSHIGTPDEVTESLSRDASLEHVTDLVVQVHSIDPPHEAILRSTELMGTVVGPALGFGSRQLASSGTHV
ncbi:putative FMN-dependent luciferase-like monooxygenase [Paeniglutamicibacter sp. NPDC091659]|uniref:putative FMN-dependent luciferase-like monooxygenase n=1 Tax=Paeniglutamicibacter sp. NPDC091659 TaxID=3364389 RepID=UPI00382C6BFD